MNNLARRNGIEIVVQVGDFGYWPNFSRFQTDLDENNKVHGTQWIFLPGNHEDWDALDKITDDHNPNTDENGFAINDTVSYTGKIAHWRWKDRVFSVAGGAYSIDKFGRTPGIDWFPQETLSEKDLMVFAATCNMNRTDVLLTHDSPSWAEFDQMGGIIPIPESYHHRQMMNQIHRMAQPKLWFHGHYHHWMNYSGYGTEVYGLDCNYAHQDGMFPSAVTLHVESLQVSRFTWGEVYDNKW